MIKLESFYEVLNALKEKEIVCTSKNDLFLMKNDKIYNYHKGSRILLTFEDFKDLYQHSNFFLYEDDSVKIDNEKDAEYYAFKHK